MLEMITRQVAVCGIRSSWQMGNETSHFSCMTKKPHMHSKQDEIILK